jgi:serine/threonine-protein kinase HipA
MRIGEVKYLDQTAGWLTQDEHGFHFVYDAAYTNSKDPVPISLTLPIQEQPYTSLVLFPFTDRG